MEDNSKPVVSVKGYYYQLDKSPYEYTSPYGDLYKMPSRKRLEMMHERVALQMERCDKFFKRHELDMIAPEEVQILVRKFCIEAIYREIVK